MSTADSDVVEFSIVVPTYNRTQELRRCLEACSKLEYDRARFEVVLVDDGGIKPIDHVVSEFSPRINLTCIRQDNAGPARARNRGVRAARGKYIALTDDDCAPEPDWLSRLQAHFEQQAQQGVAGQAENALKDNLYAETSQLLIDYLLQYYNNSDTARRFGTSNNLAFPREQLIELGCFNENFPLSAAEDRELVDRWVGKGNPLTFDPQVRVMHFHSMNFRHFVRQHVNYGRGAHTYHEVLIEADMQRPSIEPLGFYLGMLTYPFKQTRGIARACGMTVLLVVSQLANAFGYFKQRFSS